MFNCNDNVTIKHLQPCLTEKKSTEIKHDTTVNSAVKIILEL